jgi:OOP family OmpA-OmpF porin
MKTRQLLDGAAAAVVIAASSMAQAQTGAASAADGAAGRSFLPARGQSYIGLSLGRSRYSAPCGPAAFSCDSTDNSVQISAGSMVGNFWGVELAYLDMGRIGRGGGTTRAQGLNLSLVGRAPVWQALGVFGKLGTTYGRTETSAAVGSSLATGSERGFGLSYGAGVSYDFTPRLSATLAWDSHDFHFAGSGRDPVRSTSLGLQYKY